MSWEFQTGKDPRMSWEFPELVLEADSGSGASQIQEKRILQRVECTPRKLGMAGNSQEFLGNGSEIQGLIPLGILLGALGRSQGLFQAVGIGIRVEGRAGKEFSRLDSGSKHSGKIQGRSRRDECLMWKRRRRKPEPFHKLWMRKLLETALEKLGKHKPREAPALDPNCPPKTPEVLEALGASPSGIQEFLGKSRENGWDNDPKVHQGREN